MFERLEAWDLETEINNVQRVLILTTVKFEQWNIDEMSVNVSWLRAEEVKVSRLSGPIYLGDGYGKCRRIVL